jgi:hypothetical protein
MTIKGDPMTKMAAYLQTLARVASDQDQRFGRIERMLLLEMELRLLDRDEEASPHEDSNVVSISERFALRFNRELLLSIEDFLYSFKLVFDEDWAMTRDCVKDIGEENSFLNPGVDDEYNNWWNRGNLLRKYRALLATVESNRLLKFPSPRPGPATPPEAESK